MPRATRQAGAGAQKHAPVRRRRRHEAAGRHGGALDQRLGHGRGSLRAPTHGVSKGRAKTTARAAASARARRARACGSSPPAGGGRLVRYSGAASSAAAGAAGRAGVSTQTSIAQPGHRRACTLWSATCARREAACVRRALRSCKAQGERRARRGGEAPGRQLLDRAAARLCSLRGSDRHGSSVTHTAGVRERRELRREDAASWFWQRSKKTAALQN
jgi:hypothetical protein